MITVLAGGLGAARFLRGLLGVVEPESITVIGNTGDDLDRYGIRICPDLDTVTYTVSGNSNSTTGWGLEGETFHAMEAMRRFDHEPWFNLGDLDLATHLFRTERLHEGASLSQVTKEITDAFGLRFRLLPMTESSVPTRIELFDGRVVSFQEYFVKLHHDVVVRKVLFGAKESTPPAEGVLKAIDEAEIVIVAPSNPILSIGPILALPGVTEALTRRRDDVVAISPIVAGAALKGPADRLLFELGHEATALGVARMLAPVVGAMVIDTADGALASQIAALPMKAVVTNTIMSDEQASKKLASVTLSAPSSNDHPA